MIVFFLSLFNPFKQNEARGTQKQVQKRQV